MKNTYLDEILEVTRASVTEKKKILPLSKFNNSSKTLWPTRGFINELVNSIKRNQVAVIAEMKKASPSQGLIREAYVPVEIAKQYQQASAACLSVLTDEPFFQGSIEHLLLVREAANLPVLRKDFIVDEYQIYESRYKGADCILLIVAALSKSELQDFYHLALDLDLDVLVEVHNQEEVETALDLKSKLIGINNRNLETFEVDLETTTRLFEEIPEEILTVSESGIKSSKDIKRLISCGVNIFLVGEVLMIAENPGTELKNLFYK
jgi:indole-3-glycerol phosphate synthase